MDAMTAATIGVIEATFEDGPEFFHINAITAKMIRGALERAGASGEKYAAMKYGGRVTAEDLLDVLDVLRPHDPYGETYRAGRIG